MDKGISVHSGLNRVNPESYGGWDDPGVGRFEAGDFSPPQRIWERLCDADRLYYRVGSTTSANGWDDYIVTTGDDDGRAAPSVQIIGDRDTRRN